MRLSSLAPLREPSALKPTESANLRIIPSSSWLDGPRGDVVGEVLPQPVVILARLEETSQHKPGVKLPADLVFQRVAELVGRVGAVELRPLLLADVAGVGVCLLYTSRCV